MLAEGATPVPIAVIDGRIKVGVAGEELGRLTRDGVMKVASRDLPVALAVGRTGGTTVSATVLIADLVGILVVSTGGIGGVHLGGADTWDVSADVRALAEHAVAIVCAGVKSICHVARTLEVLETAGVTVVAYRTSRFPGFYALDSGYAAPHEIETPEAAAAILAAKRRLRQQTGLIVANPIPAAHALPEAQVREAVARAVKRAEAAGVRGGDLTPSLLSMLAEITGGASVRANRALLRANAILAARIARATKTLGEEWLSK